MQRMQYPPPHTHAAAGAAGTAAAIDALYLSSQLTKNKVRAIDVKKSPLPFRKEALKHLKIYTYFLGVESRWCNSSFL